MIASAGVAPAAPILAAACAAASGISVPVPSVTPPDALGEAEPARGRSRSPAGSPEDLESDLQGAVRGSQQREFVHRRERGKGGKE